MSSSSSRSATSKSVPTREERGGTAKKKVVTCPQCGAPVVWDSTNRFRPFCSERCKMIDFGRWANEEYRMPAEDKPSAEEVEEGYKNER